MNRQFYDRESRGGRYGDEEWRHRDVGRAEPRHYRGEGYYGGYYGGRFRR